VKKFILYILLAIACYLAYVGISLSLAPPVSDLADRAFTMTIQVKDWQGEYHPFVVGPKKPLLDPFRPDPARDEVGRDPGRGQQLLPA